MADTEECYVYLHRPQSAEVVTCGRFVREQNGFGDVVGRFVYGQRYREDPRAVPIDPINLPLSANTYETVKMAGVFGAIRDAGPDAWGRRVIEHALGKLDVGEIEYLLNSPEDRAGALSFGLGTVPPPPKRPFNTTLQLEALLNAAKELEDLAPGTPIPDSVQRLRELMEAGTSMGGARPKNVVSDREGIWLAKFPSRRDRWNNAAVEAAMLSLAQRCNIRVPPYRVEKVGSAPVLLLKRFDREPLESGASTYSRARMVSALTVLDAEESLDKQRWSYLLFSDELQRWSSRAVLDRAELFRRMVLNALVTNNDDHPRNHALIAHAAEWRLSPAYDITPTPLHAHERDLAMTCGLSAGRRATKANLISGSVRFGLSAEEAEYVIDDMRAVVAATWESAILSHGGNSADCEAVRPAFEIPGFDA
ncbi:HipA domain-containing protein [Gemmatimonas sp.]|uniref:type II toxin-antitoxin system HipA family toxin n=1 Tax=Gemmatimonas sp. TaxID=1962908 RepID=UPI0022C04A61|nr:HipA domain-containing protein [Gemmatimonas sp.]MCZ8203721.1 HipA domain-containing protein [Gemmatimonas sp.]